MVIPRLVIIVQRHGHRLARLELAIALRRQNIQPTDLCGAGWGRQSRAVTATTARSRNTLLSQASHGPGSPALLKPPSRPAKRRTGCADALLSTAAPSHKACAAAHLLVVVEALEVVLPELVASPVPPVRSHALGKFLLMHQTQRMSCSAISRYFCLGGGCTRGRHLEDRVAPADGRPDSEPRRHLSSPRFPLGNPSPGVNPKLSWRWHSVNEAALPFHYETPILPSRSYPPPVSNPVKRVGASSV